MKRTVFRHSILVTSITVTVAAAALGGAAHGETEKEGRVQLFNGKNLNGWTMYVEDVNHDVSTTWQVKDGVVECTGTPRGYMRTEDEYADYTLHVEWRWTGEPGNSGVLVHMSEPDKIWPRSIEAQLRNQDAGDFFVIGGTDFAEHKGKKGRRTLKMNPTNEKPAGEWNEMNVVCKGDTINVFVNGGLQNTATGCTVTKGLIALQSEGAPIAFRNVYLDPIGE